MLSRRLILATLLAAAVSCSNDPDNNTSDTGSQADDGNNTVADMAQPDQSTPNDMSLPEDMVSPQDMGTDTGVDMAPDMPPPPPPPTAGTGDDRANLAALDYSCAPTVAPADGAVGDFQLNVADFQDGGAVEGLALQYFPDNVIPADGSCVAPCIEGTTDAMGRIPVSGPEGSWYAYRVVPGAAMLAGADAEFAELFYQNLRTPMAGFLSNIAAVRGTTINLITALLQRQQSGAAITGLIQDCARNPVANVRVRLFDENGEIAYGTDPTDTADFYFDGNDLPDPDETESQVGGLFGVSSVPVPPSGVVRVEVWGVLSDGGDYERLGCEEVRVGDDAISIINIGALRSDGPAACSP